MKGAAIYEDLREKIKASAIIHADETSWRNDGIGHYAWYAGNPDLALFHIDRHRSTEVAQSILGSRFEGILVTDRYAAYNGAHAKARQACLSHLITQAKEITRELLLIKDRDRKAEAFCAGIAAFFSKTCALGQELLSGTRTWKQAPRIEKRLILESKSSVRTLSATSLPKPYESPSSRIARTCSPFFATPGYSRQTIKRSSLSAFW